MEPITTATAIPASHIALRLTFRIIEPSHL
jgi:hypothetical protein